MTRDQIRSWLTKLRQQHGWGTRVLGRTLGLSHEAAVERKANGKEWIYPSEQIRMSRQLRRIISGELACIPGKAGRGNSGKAVLAERPVPLTPPNLWAYDLKLHRLRLVPAYEPPELTLPDFETLANNPAHGGKVRNPAAHPHSWHRACGTAADWCSASRLGLSRRTSGS